MHKADLWQVKVLKKKWRQYIKVCDSQHSGYCWNPVVYVWRVCLCAHMFVCNELSGSESAAFDGSKLVLFIALSGWYGRMWLVRASSCVMKGAFDPDCSGLLQDCWATAEILYHRLRQQKQCRKEKTTTTSAHRACGIHLNCLRLWRKRKEKVTSSMQGGVPAGYMLVLSPFL